MLRFWSGLSILISAIPLSGCGETQPVGATAPGGAGFQLEEYCAVEGLEPSLRHTLIVLDETVLQPARTSEEFVTRNSVLRDTLVAFGDPERSVMSGFVDRRERLSIYLAPEHGGALQMLFTGCLPGLSAEETAEARSGESRVTEFFTGGQAQQMTEAARRFRSRLLGAASNAARARVVNEDAAPTRDYALSDKSVFRSLAASGSVLRGGDEVPRVLLITNLSESAIPQDTVSARSAGFDEGIANGVDLGRSDFIVIGPGGGDPVRREYLSAYLTAQHARLDVWSDQAPGGLQRAPRRVERYLGTAQYPGGAEVIQLRLGVDQNGQLVNSWITLRGLPDRSIPLTGQLVCDRQGLCAGSSDGGGFAQVWSLSPGGTPEFQPDMPFAGARDWRFEVSGEALQGDIYDAAIDQFGADPENRTIPIQLTLQPEADF